MSTTDKPLSPAEAQLFAQASDWRYLDGVTDTLRAWRDAQPQGELRRHYNAAIDRLEVLSSQIEQAERAAHLPE